MNVDVIVSKNVILVLPSRAIPVPLTRKFTMNNICHSNGQRTAQESRLQIKTGGSITSKLGSSSLQFCSVFSPSLPLFFATRLETAITNVHVT